MVPEVPEVPPVLVVVTNADALAVVGVFAVVVGGAIAYAHARSNRSQSMFSLFRLHSACVQKSPCFEKVIFVHFK